jgi:hypothetical protein
MARVLIDAVQPAQTIFPLLDGIDFSIDSEFELSADFRSGSAVLNNGVRIEGEIDPSTLLFEGFATLLSAELFDPDGGLMVRAPDLGLRASADLEILNYDELDEVDLRLSGFDDDVDAEGWLALLDRFVAEQPELPIDTILSDLLVDFGSGSDNLAFARDRDAITATLNEDATITIVTADGTATASNLERIELNDGALRFDLSDEAPFVYRLYSASLARTPDEGGLVFWDDAFAGGGLTRRALSNAFVGSQEFEDNFLQDPSDEAFVEALYQNVLGRTAEGDPGGAFWLNAFQSGQLTRADMLIAFADSNETVQRAACRSTKGGSSRSRSRGET